jgi:hypothetical protein
MLQTVERSFSLVNRYFASFVESSSLASQLLQGNAITCRSWLASDGAFTDTNKTQTHPMV